MTATKLNLLESDGEEEEVPQFRFNEEYGKRLEHNRKREDLQRLEELKKRGLVESSDSEDDEEEDEDGHVSKKTEVRIFETLSKIKNKDPSIYKSDVKFFNEEEEEDAEDDDDIPNVSGPAKKAVYLKDVVAQQALEGDDDDEEGGSCRKTFKTYNEEQQELKDEILKGVAEASAAVADDEEDLFKVRKKSNEELAEEKAEKNDDIAVRMDEYFGKDNELDENDKFLKDYLLNEGWIDKNKDKLPSYEDVVGEVSEEEAELDKQDEYEARFNFRFEEGASSQVHGHSRHVENSVRKLPDKRKEQRKAKQARMQEEEQARQEEVKRLKNVKKKEIMEKMSKIKTIAGVTDLTKFDEKDLEGDFDPAEYDKKMQEVFNDDYYDKDDPDANFHSADDENDDELAKPDFDAEDEELGLPQGWDKSEEGFAAFHEKQKAESKQSDDTKELSEEIKRKLEEYYKLDYEDVVGGMPTRFKYTEVKPNAFGLSTSQILEADDSELNQYISLKALAPYETQEWIPRHKHIRLTKKERKKKALDQVPSLGNAKEQNAEEEELQGAKEKKRKRETEETENHKDVTKQTDEAENKGGEGKAGKKRRKEKQTLEHKDVAEAPKDQVAKGDEGGEDTEVKAGKKRRKEKQTPEHKDVAEAPKFQDVKCEEGDKSMEEKAGKKRQKKKQTDVAEDEDPKGEEGDENTEEKAKKKRKRRKQGLNMSESRLLAYGKIDPPKKKKKH